MKTLSSLSTLICCGHARTSMVIVYPFGNGTEFDSDTILKRGKPLALWLVKSYIGVTLASQITGFIFTR